MDIKEMSDVDLMKLYQQAQELRIGYMIKKIKAEFDRRCREE